jgi:chemotaxis protein methyltransferase CheR
MMEAQKIVLTEDILDSFISILTTLTGIVPRASHRDGIKYFIEKKISENKYSIDEYRRMLFTDKKLISEFVNESTVNETYSFREEKQFALLKNKLFPQWRLKEKDKEIRMWSAACSYGEEAYSLAVMALQCGITPSVTASDINSEVIEHCKSGVFLSTSLRSVDGLSFQVLVLPYRREDRKIAFPDNIKKHIKTMNINLAELDSPENALLLPVNQNIIFIRNVFIYFSIELRKHILQVIAEKCLADDGYLFVSMNEIAQLDSSVVPKSLEKISDGSVFYFHKKSQIEEKKNGTSL